MSTARALAAAPLPIDALLDREILLSASLSPDGKWVALVVATVGTLRGANAEPSDSADVLTSDLRVVQVSDGTAIRLSPAGAQSNAYEWSSDGSMLAFDAETRSDHSLWTWDPASKDSRRIPGVQLSRGNLAWTRDGKALIASLVPPQSTFSALRRSEAQTHHAQAGDIYDDALVSGARVTVYRSHFTADRPAQATQDFRSNNRFRGDLARVDVASHRVTWLVAGMRPQSVRLSPDGQRIAFATLTGQVEGNGYRNLFDLVVVPSDGSAAAHIAAQVESIRQVLDFSWSPDSAHLAFNNIRAAHSGQSGSEDGCFILDLAGDEVRAIELHDRRDERGFSVSPYRTPLWSVSGDSLFLIGTRGLWRASVASATASLLATVPGKRVRQIIAPRRNAIVTAAEGRSILVIARDDATKAEGIVAVDVDTGATRTLYEDDANLSSAVVKLDRSVDGRSVLFPVERADQPEQLWIADSRLRHRRPLTELNPQLRKFSFGRSQPVSWKTATGATMQGALFLPAGYRKGKSYPLVVELYRNARLSENVNLFGGSSGFSTPLHHTQLLTTRGYAVLESDSSVGSATGMRDIAASVLPGIDMLVASGIADGERLGVRGQSDGAYAALSLIVQTSRFKAAVVSAGFSNLVTLYGQMHDDGTHWTMSWLERGENLGSTPWQQRDRYIDNSPYFFLDGVSTPVLLLHGSADAAVHAHLSDETFMALRRLGKEVEYAKYADEGHVILDRANAKDAAQRMLSWFGSHLQSATTAP